MNQEINTAEEYSIQEDLFLNKEKVFEILFEAGKAIMQFYNKEGGPAIKYKEDNSPVTEADIIANSIITQGLAGVIPGISMISEESEIQPYNIRKNCEYIWLIDPLDGTKEFINKTDEFSINVALIYKKRSVAGFIYLPVYKKLYYAFKGKGAFELNDDNTNQIYCSKFSLDQEGLRVVISRSHMDAFTREEIQRLKSPKKIVLGSALKFISIAKGDSDYYPRMIHIMEWDTAAGQIIIEEAGGSFEDALTGNPLEYNKPSLINPYFIASGNYK